MIALLLLVLVVVAVAGGVFVNPVLWAVLLLAVVLFAFAPRGPGPWRRPPW